MSPEDEAYEGLIEHEAVADWFDRFADLIAYSPELDLDRAAKVVGAALARAYDEIVSSEEK